MEDLIYRWVALGGFFIIASSMGVLSILPTTLILMVSLAAFLCFNRYPALLFMGDTGSLAIGAFFAGIVLVLGNVWILLPLGAIYIVETLSVIIQVVYFKRTRERIFLMAPLHHHFELLGMKETHVVWLFWSVCLLFSIGIFY